MFSHDGIQGMLSKVNATLAMEDLKPSNYATEVNSRFLLGEITAEEARKLIIRCYQIDYI